MRRLGRSPQRRLLTSVLAACLGVSLLTACVAAPELDNGVAGKLQARVASAKEFAAQKNFPAALAELQQLGQDVTTAVERGQVSQQRKTRIEAAINTLKSDLESAMTPAPQPAPTANPSSGKDGKKQEEDAKKEAENEKDKGKN
jgi:hypothetical protein